MQIECKAVNLPIKLVSLIRKLLYTFQARPIIKNRFLGKVNEIIKSSIAGKKQTIVNL